jgi:hypothetical protein
MAAPVGQAFGEVQAAPQGHDEPQAQAAGVAGGAATCVARVWQPQRQDAPVQFAQVQRVGCWSSFIVNLLGGSTTGCHRWRHFRRVDRFPTGVCDEPSARMPDRSFTSTEWFTARPEQVERSTCAGSGATVGPLRDGKRGTLMARSPQASERTEKWEQQHADTTDGQDRREHTRMLDVSHSTCPGRCSPRPGPLVRPRHPIAACCHGRGVSRRDWRVLRTPVRRQNRCL